MCVIISASEIALSKIRKIVKIVYYIHAIRFSLFFSPLLFKLELTNMHASCSDFVNVQTLHLVEIQNVESFLQVKMHNSIIYNVC